MSKYKVGDKVYVTANTIQIFCNGHVKDFNKHVEDKSAAYNDVKKNSTSDISADEAWEKASEEIQVGDIVYAEDEPDSHGIVTRGDKADAGYIYVLWDDGSCGETRIGALGLKIKKTGRHIDIQSILNQIGG